MNTPPPTNTASTSDVLSAIKNIVLALATAAQNYLNVQGITNACAITTPTVVKAVAGRVAVVSVLTAGSAPGTIYDGATLSATTKPLVPIPNIVGVFSAPVAVNFGILVIPGTGQMVSIGYS
jgi:hypothetical protein